MSMLFCLQWWRQNHEVYRRPVLLDIVTANLPLKAKNGLLSANTAETRGSSSGFVKHAERKHPTVYQKYKNCKGKKYHSSFWLMAMWKSLGVGAISI